ncbi:MAG: hypothetical protein HY050_03450, partial [Actinobacteria bacterium]|nr:hypothetical protein [Actinomycetota bacterium]
MKKITAPIERADFRLPKIKLALFLALILAFTGVPGIGAQAAVNESFITSLGLAGPVVSAKSSGGFSSGLKPPIFVDNKSGTVIAPSPSKSPTSIKGPLTGAGSGSSSGSSGSKGSTGLSGSNSGGGATAISNAVAGITGTAVVVGARGAAGAAGTQGLQGDVGPAGPQGPAGPVGPIVATGA